MVAHRGFSSKYPENTILALRKAFEAGCRGLEFDVRVTRDKELVVLHDATVDRTSDGTGNIFDLYLDEVKDLDAGSWKSPEYEGERIPLFTEVLDEFKDESVFLVAEIKYEEEYTYSMVSQVALSILARRMEHKCYVMCFDWDVVNFIKARFPTIRTGILGSGSTDGALEEALKHNHEFISWGFSSLHQLVVSEWVNNGLGVNAWTINNEASLQSIYNMGVRSLSGDDSEMLATFAHDNFITQDAIPHVFKRRGSLKIFKDGDWVSAYTKEYRDGKWVQCNVFEY